MILTWNETVDGFLLGGLFGLPIAILLIWLMERTKGYDQILREREAARRTFWARLDTTRKESEI